MTARAAQAAPSQRRIMPYRIDTSASNYNPHRPQDSMIYYESSGMRRCTSCSSAEGEPGQQCSNTRVSRGGKRCDGTVYIECDDWPYRYSTGSTLYFKRGSCTFERGHAGPCSWKRSGEPCTECEGRGWYERRIMGIWGPGELHGFNENWRFSPGGETRLPRELGREKHACRQCGGSGRMP